MQDLQWIPIGRGSRKDELEKIIATLKERWRRRYDYRIERSDDDQSEPYRLLVKHR